MMEQKDSSAPSNPGIIVCFGEVPTALRDLSHLGGTHLFAQTLAIFGENRSRNAAPIQCGLKNGMKRLLEAMRRGSHV
jgi:hypothetical protein